MQAWDVKLLLHCGPQTTHFGLERAEPVKLPFLSVIRSLTTLYYFITLAYMNGCGGGVYQEEKL